jgi:hypothetical protein
MVVMNEEIKQLQNKVRHLSYYAIGSSLILLVFLFLSFKRYTQQVQSVVETKVQQGMTRNNIANLGNLYLR